MRPCARQTSAAKLGPCSRHPFSTCHLHGHLLEHVKLRAPSTVVAAGARRFPNPPRILLLRGHDVWNRGFQQRTRNAARARQWVTQAWGWRVREHAVRGACHGRWARHLAGCQRRLLGLHLRSQAQCGLLQTKHFLVADVSAACNLRNEARACDVMSGHKEVLRSGKGESCQVW